MSDEKVRENWLRRVAERRGLRLAKCRRRDPQAYNFGGFMVIDVRLNGIVAGTESGLEYVLTLDDVEAILFPPSTSKGKKARKR